MTMASLDEFQKIDLRIGKIVEAAPHPNADRLLVLQVDLGTERRQVVAGIKASYQPDQLLGRTVALVANLDAATIRGVESQGMVLAAQDEQGIVLLTTERPVTPGTGIK